MVLTPQGYGTPLPEDLVGETKGHTKCDLRIPHKDIGEELSKIIGSIEGVTTEQKRALDAAFAKLDQNFEAIETHAAYFFRNCICHCQEENPE